VILRVDVWNGERTVGYWKGTPAEYFKLYDYSVRDSQGASHCEWLVDQPSLDLDRHEPRPS